MSDVTIVEVPEQLVLGMRRRGKYEQIAVMLPEIVQYIMQNGGQIVGLPVFVCHETGAEEVKKADSEGSADVEVAWPIADAMEGTDEMTCYRLPGGTMAKIIHRGPYHECEPTYERLFAWLERNGKTIMGPMREVYPNDPREIPPEEILMEIYAPV